MPHRQFNKEVFPDPEGPTTARHSPAAASKPAPSSRRRPGTSSERLLAANRPNVPSIGPAEDNVRSGEQPCPPPLTPVSFYEDEPGRYRRRSPRLTKVFVVAHVRAYGAGFAGFVIEDFGTEAIRVTAASPKTVMIPHLAKGPIVPVELCVGLVEVGLVVADCYLEAIVDRYRVVVALVIHVSERHAGQRGGHYQRGDKQGHASTKKHYEHLLYSAASIVLRLRSLPAPLGTRLSAYSA